MPGYLIDELSVFLPCYNEGNNLESTFNKILPKIRTIARTWEIIIVNDGSTDKTGEIARKFCHNYPDNVRIITHNHNRGYGAALKSGFYSAKYARIVLIDADGQFDFNEIDKI